MLLTIGITHYDDFAGAWATLTNLIAFDRPMLRHCEFVFIDHNPGSVDGKALRRFSTREMRSWPCHGSRYIPSAGPTGTALARDSLFREARGDFVLALDPHIVVHGLSSLIHYLQQNPLSEDLLTGPVVMDDGTTYYTHQDLQWTTVGYGVWRSDPRGAVFNSEPFEIETQGLGLFCCATDSWPGFNPDMRGLSCVEPVLCEKFRRQGGRVMCLPFLKWHHRWAFYLGSKAPNNEYDRLRNHLLAFQDVGWDIQSVLDHFSPRHSSEDILRIAEELGLKLKKVDRRSSAPRWEVLE